MKNILFIFMIPIIFLLFGCTPKQSKVNEFLQSSSATALEKDYYEVTKLLLSLKQKLDARNPNQYDKQRVFYIEKEIKEGTNKLFLAYEGKYLKDYDAYLKVAFTKKPDIQKRNDYLILGLNKLINETYKKQEGHKFTTLGFEKENFKKLYYYLKVLNWKLKTDRDEKGDYLFLTWQKNWQIELEKSLKTQTLKNLEELPHIKSKKETLLEPSNFSFEVIMNQMFFHVKNSSVHVGDEPLELSLEAMKSLVFFL